MLGKYERGEITPEDWRRFRLVRGTYGQRQDDVQMLRIKIPQGIVTSARRCGRWPASRRATRAASATSPRGRTSSSTSCRSASSKTSMRELADEGLTTREACGNSVRNITGCPYAGTSDDRDLRRDAVRRGADALLPAPSAGGVLPRKFKIAFEGCREDHAFASINDIGWRARIEDGQRGFRVTVAGGTSILPVSGYVLYDFLPGRGDVERGRGGGARLPPVRRLRASRSATV